MQCTLAWLFDPVSVGVFRDYIESSFQSFTTFCASDTPPHSRNIRRNFPVIQAICTSHKSTCFRSCLQPAIVRTFYLLCYILPHPPTSPLPQYIPERIPVLFCYYCCILTFVPTTTPPVSESLTDTESPTGSTLVTPSLTHTSLRLT